ncbi:hypothetical protein GLOIN_2v1834544 [Rhizophagus clarus]|uniref:Uncharacterized protein n=1 Tax=Rhizophagus clarus TaxID=94130 RepID=A0A8H3LV20_9GLOM|nr:hypothetical protein GLOIN_2v1834544 [Rhizophagus clarus]
MYSENFKLWKVDVDKSKLNPGSTDNVIEELGSVSMGFEYDFIDYFQEDYKPTSKKIHIVVVVATTTTATDIFDLTLGHNGLVGACGGYIQNIHLLGNDHIQTLDDWKKHTSPSCRSILMKVLRFDMCQIDLDENNTKYLLAEGFIFLNDKLPNKYGCWNTEIAAPILRSLIISTISLSDLSIPNNPPDMRTLNPRWLLARTIEGCFSLKKRRIFVGDVCYHLQEYTWKSIFSEVAAIQSFGRSKGACERWHPPSTSELSLRDGDTLPAYGFELIVSASNENFKNHIKRSQHYGKIYKCTMFMVNLCPKPILSSYFGENDEQFEDDDDDEYDDDDEDEYERVSLTPVNVIIRENLAQAWQGELKYKDGDSEVVSINVLDGTCSSIEMSLM